MLINSFSSNNQLSYFEIFHQKDGFILIWKKETPKTFQKREFEKIEVLNAIKHLGYLEDEFYYENKKPKLPNNYISISHSEGWFAIYVSSTPVGIDIEPLKNKISRVKSYFMNSSEIKQYCCLNEIQLIWCAKEAFYKLMEGQITDYQKDITITKISSLYIIIQFANKTTKLEYKKIGNTYVVWC